MKPEPMMSVDLGISEEEEKELLKVGGAEELARQQRQLTLIVKFRVLASLWEDVGKRGEEVERVRAKSRPLKLQK